MSGHVKTILVVEDEPTVLSFVGLALRKAGYRVYTAMDAAQALAIAATIEPLDVLIADVTLRGELGPELACALHLTHPELQFLFITGWDDETLRSLGFESFPALLLRKPFSIQELRRAVHRVLNSKTDAATTGSATGPAVRTPRPG